MKKTLVTAVLGTLLLGSSPLVHAVCNQTGVGTADSDLWNIHGCWSDYVLYQYQVYDLEEEDWGNRGWGDACNPVFEYPKHWNASYLIDYGLLDDNDNSFHGTTDYEYTAKKWDSNFHDDIFHTATDAGGILGRFVPHVFGADEIQSACPMFNSTSANANPGSRAANFIHEAWHAWQRKYDYEYDTSSGHLPASGGCNVPNGCDYFYFHNISAYVFGAMWENDGTANRFHSPTQVEVEFLCDVADFPQSWMPMSVRTAASSDANSKSLTRFINGPGYICGNPRPF